MSEVTIERARKALREAEEELRRELDKMPRTSGVRIEADISDIDWVRRKAKNDLAKLEQYLDERLGKIMNDYDDKIREIGERLTELEKRVPYWPLSKTMIHDIRQGQQRRIAEGENE